MSSPARHSGQSTPLRDLAYIAVFAALMAALGLIPAIPTPWTPAPITAQSLALALNGAILGPKRGAGSVALFLVLVAAGLPILAGGRGGLGVLMGPSWSFFIGWIVVTGLIGWCTYRLGAPYSFWKGALINVIFGMVVLYIFGIPGFMTVGKMSFGQAALGMVSFMPGDLTKMIIAAGIAKGVHAAIPGMLPLRRRTQPEA